MVHRNKANIVERVEYLMTGSPRTAGYPARSPITNDTLNQHRLTTPLNTGPQQMPQNNDVGPHCQIGGNSPLVMPGFPLRTSHSAHTPHYSPYSPSRFHIDKRCQHRCSWKCFSFALIFVAVILAAMLAYFAAVSSMKPTYDPNNCILVQDVKSVTHDHISQNSDGPTASPTEESLLTSTAEHNSYTTQQQHTSQGTNGVQSSLSQLYQDPQSIAQQAHQTQQQQRPVLELREFNEQYHATIPPYQFWNSEFKNKHPAFIRINFTLPWGANFAVYGRRNVAPSVTQYDFAEFIKGGRVDNRLRRRRRSSSSSTTKPIDNVNEKMLLDIHNYYEHTKDMLDDENGKSEMHSTPMPLHYAQQSMGINHNDIQSDISISAHNGQHHFDGTSARDSFTANFIRDNLHFSSDEEHLISKRSAIDAAPSLDMNTMMVNVSLLQYLDTGRWFLSVYNDELLAHSVTLIVGEAEGVSTTCPNDCSGRGSCYLGKCDCIDGFQGVDCSKSVCPVLCSGHGTYGGGMCHCHEGYKGAECEIPAGECQVPGCNGKGRCIEGECHCNRGFKGNDCSEPDCMDPTCSSHGTCINGQCFCKAGWQGEDCSTVDQQVYQCLPGCSERGTYDLETGTCICDRHWTGPDCSQAVCSLDCGPNGICESGKCRCNPGYVGNLCDQLPCDSRCAEHGQCKNGTCVCSQGWNGRHCTLPGCENGCSRHGQCTLEDGEYKCVCIEGWSGPDCSIQLEMNCNDNIDNDHDGMTDCSDSECCSHPICAEHIMCLASNDPVEVLLRKQPPSVTASFYQRVKFLIEENSVQSYAHMDEYSESEFWNSFTPGRVSVMRGQVITPQGLGIVGIRVSVDRDSRFGFTLTRQGGWFDVLVNGGGAVTLQFQRSPFHPMTRTVFVPWNQIVVLPPIQMQLNEDEEQSRLSVKVAPPNPAYSFLNTIRYGFDDAAQTDAMLCMDHDHELLKPQVISTWMPSGVGSKPGKRTIFAETQIVQETIQIPGSELHLTYQSSQASGYLSLVRMRLTKEKIPKTLTHVHVGVEIEGSLHVKTYEADPNLSHTFAWNKRNVYKQKVYGISIAHISVGYQYSTCAEPVWETQTAKLQGFDVDISDIGGWGLDIHHHYNFHEGILQKGDGSTMHLKEYPRVVKIIMGTGLQRPLNCPDHCNGVSKDARLLTPIALATGADGSLYVGDFNLVRRITPDGKVYTVLQLSATQVSYQYYLTVSPADGHLYISDPEKHQILRVVAVDKVHDPTSNSDPVVGNGQRCVPGDETNCGDNGPALQARLSHPKGIVIAADRTMYIADGTNIRAVDPNGIIHTLIGHHGHNNVWSPAPCKGALLSSETQLQWPTGLALSPLDGSLHFIDDRLVLKLTADMKIKVVAGTPLHCNANGDNKNQTSQQVLGTVLALAFSPNGYLYVADSDSRRINSIRVIDTAANMKSFAGRQDYGSCECANGNGTQSTTVNPTRNNGNNGNTTPVMFGGSGGGASNSNAPATSCSCGNLMNPSNSGNANAFNININNGAYNDGAAANSADTLLSSNAKFQAISAIAVSQDGVINVADQGSLHILALQHYLPTHDENGEFHIPYPPTNEIYVFNRYGQHVTTKDLTSAKTRYSFLYSKNTSFGKLSTVTDSSGNKIQFLRDYSNIVSSIENTQDHKSELKISGIGLLSKLTEKGKSEYELDYDSTSGLLNSLSCGAETYIYQYDDFGRAIRMTLPSGETISIGSKLGKDIGLTVKVSGSIPSLFSQLPETSGEVSVIGGIDSLVMNRTGRVTRARFSLNNTLRAVAPNGVVVEAAAISRHPFLESSLPVESEMLPMWSHQIVTMGESLTNNMYSIYSLIGDLRNPQQTLNREIWVNNTRAFCIQYDQFSSVETFYDKNRRPIFAITFDPSGMPLSYAPANGGYPLNFTYDRFNRIEGWSWGPSELKYTYDRHGLLSEITSAQDGIISYVYNDWNLISEIGLASQRKFAINYDENGGLRHIVLPSGTKHSFSMQPSIGFIRVTYTPPGSTKPYLQHYTQSGALLHTVFPGDGAHIVYRYNEAGQLSRIIHGDGKSEFEYNSVSGMPTTVTHVERELEYRWDFEYTGGLLTEERIDFEAKSALSNAKFTYDYDTNFRVTSIQGRIGGQNLPTQSFGYNVRTGKPSQIGPFKINTPRPNQTQVNDGTASFIRTVDGRFLETQMSVTIHRLEVFRMEFSHDMHGRISQTRTYTRNVGVNTYTNVKNYTWDCDGQLIGVEAQEPWGFRYDDNGNMLSLTYRGNTIPMEYNALDRIVKFGDGQYKYDGRGLVSQNAREERFHYNTQGLLVRAQKRGRFDIHYYYDHMNRLITRKDNYGNVTQFFYNNKERLHQVSQIYSPRDGKLMSLVYDDRGHLIYAQVFRHKYYIATDQCGTPVMIFNQYGEGIREIMRSPYGHIVYDSNPYLYLPIDFCGGILDQVTTLVHMPNGKVYDPLIGQWMSPNWENVAERIGTPTKLHLYRFNGNDPINVEHDRNYPQNYQTWLKLMGYHIKNLMPQLVKPMWQPQNLWGSVQPSIVKPESHFIAKDRTSVESGFLTHLAHRRLTDFEKLSAPPRSLLKMDLMNVGTQKIGAASDPPFGKGIVVSRTKSGQAIVSSVPAANAIYRDVYTSVFNRSSLLPFIFVVHNSQQDAFYFVKEESWRASEDRQQLKRLQGQVNTTFHEIARENGSGNNYLDVKIHGAHAVINLRYGTTVEKEKQRLMHHAKLQAVRKAWHREKEALRAGLTTTTDWTQAEIDEILKQGYVNQYEGDYIHDVNMYPELSEDPYNIRFSKKKANQIRRRRRRSTNA
ncbi:teneurin-a isoform X5 [Contarinia nasturtii]|uniref:teneurin-a isoform X5 n=1 Tax=Contarinia nasturtii TaxID=265458 RepID=UPI0012D47031|nr:teneurin-a isoform X5 [Contarinia nasturtii]